MGWVLLAGSLCPHDTWAHRAPFLIDLRPQVNISAFPQRETLLLTCNDILSTTSCSPQISCDYRIDRGVWKLQGHSHIRKPVPW